MKAEPNARAATTDAPLFHPNRAASPVFFSTSSTLGPSLIPPGVVDPVVSVDPGIVLLELRSSVDPVPDISILNNQISNFAQGTLCYRCKQTLDEVGLNNVVFHVRVRNVVTDANRYDVLFPESENGMDQRRKNGHARQSSPLVWDTISSPQSSYSRPIRGIA